MIRQVAYRVMTSRRIGHAAPGRTIQGLMKRLNATFGEPLADTEVIRVREAAKEQLATLRITQPGPAKPSLGKIQAPVVVYTEGDRNITDRKRIVELLHAKGIIFQELDVATDETSRSFVVMRAKKHEITYPVVFVANTYVGDYRELVASDVAGTFDRLLRGE